MRFLILRKADEQTEAGAMPTERVFRAMDEYMEEMARAGILRGGEGLERSAKSVRVRFAAGKPTVIDGPFAEAKELVAGYCVIDVPSYEDAVAWAKRWPAIEFEENVVLDVRRVLQPEDFAPVWTTAELREDAERLWKKGQPKEIR